MAFLNQDISNCINEFAASAAFANVTRINKDARVLRSIARLYDNDFGNLLASHQVDHIAYAMCMYDQNSFLLRFCNLELNTIHAINHKYSRIVEYLASLGSFGHSRVYKYVIKCDLERWFPQVIATAPYVECMKYAIECKSTKFINEHYDPNISVGSSKLMDAVIGLGCECALKFESPVLCINRRCMLLMRHGRLQECIPLIPKLKPEYALIVRCEQMNASGDFRKLHDLTRRAGKLGDYSVAVSLGVQAIEAQQYHLLCDVVTVEPKPLEYILRAAKPNAKACHAIMTHIRRMRVDAVRIMCEYALSRGMLDVFEAYHDGRPLVRGLVFAMAKAPIASGALLKYFPKCTTVYEKTHPEIALNICEAVDIEPYISILDTLDESLLFRAAVVRDNVALMEYLVKRGAAVECSTENVKVVNKRAGKSVNALVHLPKVLQNLSWAMLCSYCTAIGKIELFKKYFAAIIGEHGVYSGVVVRVEELGVDLVAKNETLLFPLLAENDDFKTLKFIMKVMDFEDLIHGMSNDNCNDVNMLFAGQYWDVADDE